MGHRIQHDRKRVISSPLESVGIDLKAAKSGFATMTDTCANFPRSPGIFCQIELSYQFGFMWWMSLPRKLHFTATSSRMCASKFLLNETRS